MLADRPAQFFRSAEDFFHERLLAERVSASVPPGPRERKGEASMIDKPRDWVRV
jgi:hypothetical protein